MTDMKILGIVTQRGFDPSRTFSIAAFGDVALEDLEITMRGVALAWSRGKFVALPPKIPGTRPGDLNGVQWNISGAFAVEMRDKLLAAYEAFGGDMPSESNQRHGNAARRIAEKRAKLEPTPAEDEPDNSGLHRLVGADISEAMSEAGL